MSALLSPPPWCHLSLPAVYAPPAKFPSTHQAPTPLVSTSAWGRARGQRPFQPWRLWGAGTEGLHSCYIPVPPGSGIPRTHHHGHTSCDCMGGARGDPSDTPGYLGAAWGHPCRCWSITKPPPNHKVMELNVQEVPQQGTCTASAGPGDASGWGEADSGTCRALCQAAAGRRPVSLLVPCPGALGQLPPQSLTQ